MDAKLMYKSASFLYSLLSTLAHRPHSSMNDTVFFSSFSKQVELNDTYTWLCYTNVQLYTPRPNTELVRNVFIFQGTSIWNSIPEYIKTASSLKHFKSLYLRWY